MPYYVLRRKPPMTQSLLATPDRATEQLNVRLPLIVKRVTDDFEWNGQRWRLRFQSWVRKPQEGSPTLDSLREILPEDDPKYLDPLPPRNGYQIVEYFILSTLNHEAKKQSKSGWHLKQVGGGVGGWFDLRRLPKESTDKKPFASFDFGDYRCQFHILRLPGPSEKPIAWDNSRGAKAGLPTLGKRR